MPYQSQVNHFQTCLFHCIKLDAESENLGARLSVFVMLNMGNKSGSQIQFYSNSFQDGNFQLSSEFVPGVKPEAKCNEAVYGSTYLIML